MNATAEKLLTILDEAISPELTRNRPTVLPTYRVRALRPIFHSAFAGKQIKAGTILPLTLDELNSALFEKSVELLDPLPQTGSEFYES